MFRGETTGGRKRPAILLPLLGGVIAMLALSGCYQKMGLQPAFDPYDQSDFFEDGMSARPRVEGTVARGEYSEDELLHTGRSGGQLATMFPFPVTGEVLDRGQERFNIYCSVCHGPAGEGDGMIVRRGYKKPNSFHSPTVAAQPEGYYFTVMTQGFGVMPSYAAQVPVEDRWAIVAYIRALQLSQRASVADIPAEELSRLESAPQGGAE